MGVQLDNRSGGRRGSSKCDGEGGAVREMKLQMEV